MGIACHNFRSVVSRDNHSGYIRPNMSYRDFNEDELILRDHLALDRTRLAIERTFLAYVRTAIMVAVSGVTLIKLFPDSWSAQISGWGLALFRYVCEHQYG